MKTVLAATSNYLIGSILGLFIDVMALKIYKKMDPKEKSILKLSFIFILQLYLTIFIMVVYDDNLYFRLGMFTSKIYMTTYFTTRIVDYIDNKDTQPSITLEDKVISIRKELVDKIDKQDLKTQDKLKTLMEAITKVQANYLKYTSNNATKFAALHEFDRTHGELNNKIKSLEDNVQMLTPNYQSFQSYPQSPYTSLI